MLQNKYARILTVALVAQAAFFYATSRGENVPTVRPLRDFPRQVGNWTMVKEGYVDDETQAVLKADDTLTRVYARSRTEMAPSLFIAFFKTQRTGKTPHSPKNCLPGSGWEPSKDDHVTIAVPGLNEPITVNRYMVAKGDEKSAVLYWYQTPSRVVASEYKSKFFTVADAIRYNRTDISIVRVMVPVLGGDEATAQKSAIEFVQSIFGTLRQYLPT